MRTFIGHFTVYTLRHSLFQQQLLYTRFCTITENDYIRTLEVNNGKVNGVQSFVFHIINMRLQGLDFSDFLNQQDSI